jgi:hypothetical protein
MSIVSNGIDSARGILHIPPEKVKMDPIFKVDGYWTEFMMSKNFQVSADSMMFESKVINNPEMGGQFCHDIIVFFYCEHGTIRYNLIGEGCSKWLTILVSDSKLSGETHELKVFTRDLSTWHKIGLETRNKNATFFLDGKSLLSIPYNQNLGQLKVVNYVFKGCGSIDMIHIKDLRSKTEFYDDFN